MTLGPSHRALLVALSAWCAACDEADVVDCGLGVRQEAGGETYCVYAPGSGEPRDVTCPRAAPVRIDVGDTVICTTDRSAASPGDVPPDVCAGCGGDAGAPCPGGRTRCGDTCTDPATDPLHCGGCGIACVENERCAGGACVCDGAFTTCGPSCVDLSRTRGSCGACGIVCEAGFECCDGECVDVRSDASSCGACGEACELNQICVAAACWEGNDECLDARNLPVRPGAASYDPIAGLRQSSLDGCTAASDVFYAVTLEMPELVQLESNTVTGGEVQVARLDGPCGTTAAICTRGGCDVAGTMLVEALPAGRHLFVVEGGDEVTLRHLPVPDGVIVGTLVPPASFSVDASTDAAADVAGSCDAGADVGWALATCPSFPGGTLTVTTCGAVAPTIPARLSVLSADGVATCGFTDMRCPMGSNVTVDLPAGAGLYAVLAELPAGASGVVVVNGTFD